MIPGISIDVISHMIEQRADELIIPRFGKLRPEDIDTKTHANDFVTIADTETERALREDLTRYIPGCIVIGEEAVSSGVMGVEALADPSKIVFVADPVDGTYNFRHANPTFGVMLALVHGGETLAGWIYDVMNATHYIAVKGQGAFKIEKGYTGSCQKGERLSVAAPKDLNDPKIDGFLEAFYFPKEMHPFLQQELNGRFRSLRCSAHEYIQVARGLKDFDVSHHMKPWDHLPGALLVQEAGGIVQKFDGSPYAPTDETGGLISVSNATLARQLQDKFIQPGLKFITPPEPPKP